MRKEDTQAFIKSCTSDDCLITDPWISKLFNYDVDNDGAVTRDEFVEFYRSSSVQRPEVVWQNIISHNYTHDLKKITDLSFQNADKTLLPRFILSNRHEYFDLLFSLLENDDPVSLEAWNLI